MNSYRNKINSDYGIIKSNFFENERLTSVDYLVLNNNPNNQIENHTKYPYRNNTKNDVQVALFYGNEIEYQYDYLNKVPYFTTILKSGKKTELPIDEKQEIYLYTFDKNGTSMEKHIITPANKAYN